MTRGAQATFMVDCSGYDQGLCMAYLGLSGAAAGGLLGAVFGKAIRTERWTELRLDPGGSGDGFAWRLEVRLAVPL